MGIKATAEGRNQEQNEEEKQEAGSSLLLEPAL